MTGCEQSPRQEPAAERRHSLARDVSPWNRIQANSKPLRGGIAFNRSEFAHQFPFGRKAFAVLRSLSMPPPPGLMLFEIQTSGLRHWLNYAAPSGAGRLRIVRQAT